MTCRDTDFGASVGTSEQRARASLYSSPPGRGRRVVSRALSALTSALIMATLSGGCGLFSQIEPLPAADVAVNVGMDAAMDMTADVGADAAMDMMAEVGADAAMDMAADMRASDQGDDMEPPSQRACRELRDHPPVGYWSLNDTEADRGDPPYLYLNTGAGSSVAGVASMILNPGPLGSGRKFDAERETFIAVPHEDSLTVEQGTISLFVKLGEVSGEREQGILSRDRQGFETGGHMAIVLSPQRHIVVRLQSDSETFSLQLESTALSEQDWHHVALSFDGSMVRLYIDGVMQREVFSDYTFWRTEGRYNNREPFVIGAKSSFRVPIEDDPYQGIHDFFDGLIEGIALHDRPWSGAHIDALSKKCVHPS